MDLVPRLLEVALAGLALAGSMGAALADDKMSSDSSLIAFPHPLPSTAQSYLLQTDGNSSFGLLPQKFGIQPGRLNFFSVRPESSGDLNQLLRDEPAGGGLKLQFKW
jgi:hypothetical protein